MKIYTKKGDKGQTTLVDGTPVAKSDGRLATYGTVDELNAHLGLLASMLENEAELKELKEQLIQMQNWLFQLGSQLACSNSEVAAKLPSIEQSQIQTMEMWIDQWDKELPELKNFILPGGHWGSAQAQVCRTVCRRAERLCVTLDEVVPFRYPAVSFLNRASDYFFVVARIINHKTNFATQVWKP